MAKTIKTGSLQKKESSAEKRRRRENIARARAQAHRFVLPLLVLGFLLLAGWLFLRFGSGKKLTAEERQKIKSRREMARMLRKYGGDYEKLREILAAGGAGAGVGQASEGAQAGETNESADSIVDSLLASDAGKVEVDENAEAVVEEVVADEP